jgi:hypothetical protein
MAAVGLLLHPSTNVRPPPTVLGWSRIRAIWSLNCSAAVGHVEVSLWERAATEATNSRIETESTAWVTRMDVG